MRWFQRAQNHKNPITGCGEIDRQRSTSHRFFFRNGLLIICRSLTINFSVAGNIKSNYMIINYIIYKNKSYNQ